MTITRQTLGALALGLVVAAASSPGFAQRAEQESTDSARARSIQDCSNESNKMTQSTWGVTQLNMYRSCMMQKGMNRE
jgi:hypothetical protein